MHRPDQAQRATARRTFSVHTCENARFTSQAPAGVPVSMSCHDMEAEHINHIGDQIDDLRARTDALRGYL